MQKSISLIIALRFLAKILTHFVDWASNTFCVTYLTTYNYFSFYIVKSMLIKFEAGNIFNPFSFEISFQQTNYRR